MSFSHSKLDVYRVALEYIHWVYQRVEKLTGLHRHARDQLLRASQSIPLNIAEGNGKYAGADRANFFSIARGSALECAAIQDVLLIAGAISEDDKQQGDQLLERIVAMLSKMARQKTGAVREGSAGYGVGIDHDDDHENDDDFKTGRH